MSVRNQPQIYEVKRHCNERHPLFYFMSFINPYFPLTDIVIGHICYIHETTPRPPLAHSSPTHPPIPRANSKTTLQLPFNPWSKAFNNIIMII
jgi:hypothetical protein